MHRRSFLTLLGISATAWPLMAGGRQRPARVIGYVSTTPNGREDDLRAFRQGLKEGGGFIEGENVAIEYRWGDNEPDRLPALAADLVRKRVNWIAVTRRPA